MKLSQLPGVEVQAVADALEIHPFMLSRWRKEARGWFPTAGSSLGLPVLFHQQPMDDLSNPNATLI